MKKHDDSLIDTFDFSVDYYEICAAKKVKGASNSDLKAFLEKEGMDELSRNSLVKQVDEDFLEGLLGSKIARNYSALRVVFVFIGWLFIFGGLFGLIYMFFAGYSSMFIASLLVGATGAGTTLIFTNGKRVRSREKRQSIFEQGKKKRL